MDNPILKEELVKICEVPRVIKEEFPYWPTKPHKHTVWRWYWKPTSSGHQLEGVKLAGEIYTSRQAIRRFFEAAMIDQPHPNAKHARDAGKRQRVSKAKRKMARQGA